MILFETLFRGAAVVPPPGRAWLVPAALAMFCTVIGLAMPPNFMTGPARPGPKQPLWS